MRAARVLAMEEPRDEPLTGEEWIEQRLQEFADFFAVAVGARSLRHPLIGIGIPKHALFTH